MDHESYHSANHMTPEFWWFLVVRLFLRIPSKISWRRGRRVTKSSRKGIGPLGYRNHVFVDIQTDMRTPTWPVSSLECALFSNEIIRLTSVITHDLKAKTGHSIMSRLSHLLLQAKTLPMETWQSSLARLQSAIDVLFPRKHNVLRLLRIFLLPCAFVLIPGTSHAQQESLLSSASVAQIVEDLKNTIHSTISAIETTYSNSAFRTRQHLQILLNQLETVSENVSESTFSKLSVVEQKFFTDLAVQIDSLRTLEKISSNDAENITRSMASAISNLPFADAVPIVFYYDPMYVVGGNENSELGVTVVVSGALLSAGNPTLTLDGKACRRDGKIHTSLTFFCANEPRVFDESTANLTGTLKLYEEKSTWDRTFSRDQKEYTYDVVISVLPRQLGKVGTRITYEKENSKRDKRSQEFSEWNSHCAGARNFLFEFNAKHGWEIDVNSIKVKYCDGGEKSRCNGLRHVSVNSFAYSCHLENYGICTFISRDARGHCYGEIEWYETTTETIEGRQELGEVEVFWGEDRLIPLREGTKTVEISLRKADGDERIFTKSDNSDAWVKVLIDLTGGRAIISPRDLEIAMK